MTVRAADASDVPALCVLGRLFYGASQYAEFVEWDAASFETTARALINGSVPGRAFVFDDADGAVVGMAAFVIAPFFFNLSALFAQETFWYSAPGRRAGMPLLDAMEDEARGLGAKTFVMSALSGNRDPAFVRLYTKRGYRAAENSFIKVF